MTPFWRTWYAITAGTNVWFLPAVLILLLKPEWFARAFWALPALIVLAYALAPWLRTRVRLTLRDFHG